MRENRADLKIGFDLLTRRQEDLKSVLHGEIEEVREMQRVLISNQEADRHLADRSKPKVNGVNDELISRAAEFGIDLTVSMLVISKRDSKHGSTKGQAVNLISHTLNPLNRNKYCRAVFDDLFSKREQADHSLEGNTGKLGDLDEERFNQFKG